LSLSWCYYNGDQVVEEKCITGAVVNSRLKQIFSRRSVRKYENREVSKEIVRDLLDAAMAAPSACCKDPWRFVVITRKETLAKLADGLPNGKMLATAPLGIVVCGDMKAAHDNQVSYLLQDCSAAIENLLLAASMLGLGAVWLGVHPREDRMAHVAKLLGIPSGVVPVAALAIGWPAEIPVARTRYVDESVRREEW
jgi:nitroreductase